MNPTPSALLQASFERSLAVVIGIDSYSHGIPPLHNAVRDATAVADALERQGFEVLRLLDSQASLQALSELLSKHLPSLQPRLDRLLIYFAGHGLAHTDQQHQLSGFLLPSDAHRDVPSSYWPMASLREALRQLPCRHLLLILDCCFAGAFPHAAVRDLRPPPSSTPLYLERFRHFSSHRSFQLLLSTAHDELASDRLLAKPSQETLGDGQHSPFALALLQSLQPHSPADFNQDGLLTASELYTFLRDRLVRLLPSHHQQTPSLWNLDWHDGGEFLFCLTSALPDLPSAAPLSKDFNPYLGLRPFSAAHRHLFFGREHGVDSLCEHIRTHPLLLLCGPSGAGKSSLVHAGILPRMVENSSWHAPASLRPSARPLHALAAWLASLAPAEAPPSAAALASRPEDARDFLCAVLARRPEVSLILVIDPLEELVTACLDNHRRGAFLRALSSILQIAHPRLRAVLLLRSDFEPHFLSLLSGTSFPLHLWHDSRVTVPPMNRDELRRCIEKPAEVRTLFFAPGLVERLLDGVEQMPGALPLLSVALSELFDAHLDSGREDRTLTFADYERLGGGIAGALQRRAELVFAGAPPPWPEGQPALPPLPASELPAFQQTLRNVLLRMASPEGGELTRRRVRRAELGYPHPEENARVQRALLTLEASRLIVASDDGGPCVEPAHDALLTAWPRLHDWVRQAQRELLLLRRISHAAAEWARQGHAADFLWINAHLDQHGLVPASLRDARVPLALPTSSPGSQPSEPLAFNTEESAFLRASEARRRLLRRRRYYLQLTVAASILLLAVIALFQAGSAKREQQRAEANAQQYLEQKRAAQAEKLRAQAQEAEAVRERQSAQASAEEARQQREAAETSAEEARQQREAAEASAEEARQQREIAETKAVEARQQREIAQTNAESAHQQEQAARASAQRAYDQEQAAVASALEAQRQREAADTNALEAQWQREAADTNALEAQRQKEAAVGNAQEALLQKELAEQSASEARHQQRLASRNAQEAREQRDAAEANALRAQAETERALFSAKLTQAEKLLKEDPTKAALVLQEAITSTTPPDNTWLQTALALHQQEVSEALLTGPEYSISIPPQFSPDGTRVLAISGNALYLWRADGTGQPLILLGSEKPLYAATFSPDGSLVLAFSAYQALLWRTDRTEPPRVLMASKDRDPAYLGTGSFSQDGRRLLITGDHTLRVWRTDDLTDPVDLVDTPPGSPSPPLSSAAFSPDGSRILTSASDGTTRLWNADGTSGPLTLSDPSTPAFSAQFSPDGSLIAARSNAAIRLWSTNGRGNSKTIPTTAAFLDSVSFSPRGDYILATTPQGAVIVWRVNGTDPARILSPLSTPMRSARFSQDGAHVLALVGNTARVWNLAQGGTAVTFSGSCDYMKSAQFSPAGGRIATLCLNGTAALWHTDGQEEPQTLSTPVAPVDSVSFSPDGMYAVTNSGSSAQLWRADVPGAPRSLNGHTQDIRHVVFSPDGARLLTTAGQSLRVWRTRPSGSVPFPRSVSLGVAGATVSPDGNRLLTTSFDYTVHLWSMRGLHPPTTVAAPAAHVFLAQFSDDGSQVLTYSFDGTRHLWSTAGEGAPSHLPATNATDSVSLSHKDPLLLKSGSQYLTLWPAVGVYVGSEDGRMPSLLLPYGGLSSAFFLPDGLRIATLSPHELRTWPVAPSLLSTSLGDLTTSCLSSTERINFLRETPSEASSGFHRCELSHGRAPAERRMRLASNPIDEPAFFVTQLYLDLLERPPSVEERRHLISFLVRCDVKEACLYRARIKAAQSVFESSEHRGNQNLYEGAPGYSDRYVARCYSGFARRRPEGQGDFFWRSGIHLYDAYSNTIEGFLLTDDYRARFGSP
jgi:WD40 repeat protein